MGFRTHLEQAKSATGKPLGKSTTRAILATLREFVLWLSQQEGFRSRIKAADADYFNLSRRDEAEARAAPPRPAPSVNQAKRALAMMPDQSPREMRDKTVFALLCLTGIRVAALVSLRIKHVNLAEKSVTQLHRTRARWRPNLARASTPFLPTSSKMRNWCCARGLPTLTRLLSTVTTTHYSRQPPCLRSPTQGSLPMASLDALGKVPNPCAKS